MSNRFQRTNNGERASEADARFAKTSIYVHAQRLSRSAQRVPGRIHLAYRAQCRVLSRQIGRASVIPHRPQDALRPEGRASAAVIHLYDQRTNTYNIPFVQRLVPGTPASSTATQPTSAPSSTSADPPPSLSGHLNRPLRSHVVRTYE